MRVALIAGSAVAVGMPAYAQDAELEQIIVTGSRIKRAAETETVQPVSVISRDDIETQGFTSVSDILQNQAAAGFPPISRSSPLSAGEAAGGTYISLRNLGASRTLVLMNGRRLPVTTSGLADVSLIPSIAVERVEVLKEGASSLYGSDAIGGVVNIITRKDYDGLSASAYYGAFDEGDGETKRAEFIGGWAGEKGSVTVSGEWADEGQVWSADRPYSAFPRSYLHPTDGWTTVGQQGGFAASASAPVSGYASGRYVLRPDGTFTAQDINTGSCAAPAATVTGGCVPGSTADKSNTNLQTHLRTPLERRSLNIDASYDFTDSVRLSTNFLYSNRETVRTVAGYPYQAASFATPMAANSYFNPTNPNGQYTPAAGTTTNGSISGWWRRTWEVPRVSGAEVTTYNLSAILDGDFEVFEREMSWEGGYIHNYSDQLQSTYGNLNVTRVAQAVGPSFLNAQGQVQCGTAAAPILFTTCVPWNPFAPFGSSDPNGLTNNDALTSYLFQEEHARGNTKTTVWFANLTGSAFTLPAGDLAFALGYEHRLEQGEFVPDALAVTGTSTNLAAGPTEGGYSVDEVYLEVDIPIVRDVMLLNELSLNAATRYSDFDTFGDTANSKVALKWKPIEELLFRGTWSEGFRAPTIANLYGGGSQTFPTFTDPCDTVFGSAQNNPTTAANCASGNGVSSAALGALQPTFRQLAQGFVPTTTAAAQTPVAFTSGSNPTLQPEESVSKTAGFVWSPRWVPRLNIGADWWHIRIDNTIVADSVNDMLNDCYVQGLASRCTTFTRDATQGYITALLFGDRNAGYREVEGYDFTLGYAFNTGFGEFSLNSSTTYTDSDVLISTNDPRFPTSNVGRTFAGTAGSYWRVRSNFNLGWNLGSFGANWMARYYSPLEESCTYFVSGTTEPNLECNSMAVKPTGLYAADGSPATALTRENKLGSVVFHDVQFRYEAPWDATIALGANNVFDKVGPVTYIQSNSNVSYNGAYDLDRTLYVKYTQRF